MTNEEAKRVAEICMTADGECSWCAESLHILLVRAFPEVQWKEVLHAVWAKTHGDAEKVSDGILAVKP